MAGVLPPVGFCQLGVKRTHHSTTTICQVFNLLQIQHVHGKSTRTGRCACMTVALIVRICYM